MNWKAQFEVLPRSGQERIEKTTETLCHLVGVRSKFQPDTQSDTDLIGVFCQRTVKVKVKGRVASVKAMKVYRGSGVIVPLIQILSIIWR
jgi:hypothetical protein